jgi:hypothetical protein
MNSPANFPGSDPWAIDELFGSLARGDLAGARSCFTPEARIWHSFDCIALNLEQACSGWREFISAFPQRNFTDVQRVAMPGGFVQRHLLVVRDSHGIQRAWPTCIFVRLQGRLITRLDEYLDRAGSLTGDVGTTPGLS